MTDSKETIYAGVSFAPPALPPRPPSTASEDSSNSSTYASIRPQQYGMPPPLPPNSNHSLMAPQNQLPMPGSRTMSVSSHSSALEPPNRPPSMMSQGGAANDSFRPPSMVLHGASLPPPVSDSQFRPPSMINENASGFREAPRPPSMMSAGPPPINNSSRPPSAIAPPEYQQFAPPINEKVPAPLSTTSRYQEFPPVFTYGSFIPATVPPPSWTGVTANIYKAEEVGAHEMSDEDIRTGFQKFKDDVSKMAGLSTVHCQICDANLNWRNALARFVRCPTCQELTPRLHVTHPKTPRTKFVRCQCRALLIVPEAVNQFVCPREGNVYNC